VTFEGHDHRSKFTEIRRKIFLSTLRFSCLPRCAEVFDATSSVSLFIAKRSAGDEDVFVPRSKHLTRVRAQYCYPQSMQQSNFRSTSALTLPREH